MRDVKKLRRVTLRKTGPNGRQTSYNVWLDEKHRVVRSDEDFAPAAGAPPVSESRPSDSTREAMAILDSGQPCRVPGCHELRAAYRRDLGRLGPNCPACDKGAVYRKYFSKAKNLIERTNHGK